MVAEKLEGTDFFVVNISVEVGNKIKVQLDGMNGFPISECVNFSRHIEFSLDREVEDFSLQVSSPGLTKPFRVFKQYEKNIGRNIKVIKTDGEKVKGELISASEEEIELKYITKERLEGKKKKVEVTHEVNLPMSDIKEAKVELDF